jgi:thioredoxin 1
MTTHVSCDTEFASLLEKGKAEQKPVFVKFGAVWCGPCKAIAPKFDALAAKYKNYAYFCSIDIDELEDVASTFKVRSVPMFCAVFDLAVREQWAGANPVILEQKIQSHCARALN